MIERTKPPEPANDNYTDAERRALALEQRIEFLSALGRDVDSAKVWLQERRKELFAREASDSDSEKALQLGALTTLERAITKADKDIDAAEGDPNSHKAYLAASNSYSIFEAFFEQTRLLFEGR